MSAIGCINHGLHAMGKLLAYIKSFKCGTNGKNILYHLVLPTQEEFEIHEIWAFVSIMSKR